MTTLMLLAMLQYVISAKAGLVNHIEGQANVAVTENVVAGELIKTGPGSYAEILLNPGSFIRLGGNSEMILETTDITAVALRIVSGSAVLEAAGVSKDRPIQVTVGEMELNIIDDGIYAFEDGEARILSGKVTMDLFARPISKGLKLIPFNDVYKQVPLPKGAQELSSLERWSLNRSRYMSVVNYEMVGARTSARLSQSPAECLIVDCWIFSSRHSAFTFLPRRGYVSPYGQTFQTVGYNGRRSVQSDENSAAGGGGGGTSPGVGSAPGGGSARAPVERPAAREVIRNKDPKVPIIMGPPNR